jgi:hypothetical protein
VRTDDPVLVAAQYATEAGLEARASIWPLAATKRVTVLVASTPV